MQKDFLLSSNEALRLYDRVKNLPIIDFHNHLSAEDILKNRRYENVCELCLECDPYKHRLMRISGIPEKYITGEVTPKEKFLAFAKIFPYLIGNPVYDWSRMEFSSVFGIDEILSEENAERIYDECNEKLKSEEFRTVGILSRFGIEYQSPVADIFDDLSFFDGEALAPSLRADNLLSPTEAFKKELERKTGKQIFDLDSYISSIGVMLDRFAEKGCKFADHSLDCDFFETDGDGKKQEILTRLMGEYKKKGFNLLLHLNAKRKTSERLRRLVGPQGGFAAVGGSMEIAKLVDLLGKAEESAGLPDTVLFPLNMSDQPPLAAVQGSFSEDGVSSKVQLGPAWWWCDHSFGIKNTLNSISSLGMLSEFIGMTTDSRSLLSFVRHDYFRRILSSYLCENNYSGSWGATQDTLYKVAEKICYKNAKKKIGRV